MVQREGRAEPANVAFDATLGAAHQAFAPEACEQLAGVVDIELETQRRAPGACARTGRPVAGGRQPGFGHHEVEPVQPPFAHPRRAAAVDRFDLHPTQSPAAQAELFNGDVKGGHAAGLLQDLLHLPRRPRREVQAGQPCKNAAAARRTRLAVFDIPIQFFRIDVGAPQAALARCAHHHVVEAAPVDDQPLASQAQGGGQVAQAGAVDWDRRIAHGHPGGGGERALPGLRVQQGCLQVGHHARRRQGRALAAAHPHTDAAAQHAGFGAGDVAFVAQGRQGVLRCPDVHREAVGQRQFATRTAGDGLHRVFKTQRQAVGSGLAQRGR